MRLLDRLKRRFHLAASWQPLLPNTTESGYHLLGASSCHSYLLWKGRPDCHFSIEEIIKHERTTNGIRGERPFRQTLIETLE